MVMGLIAGLFLLASSAVAFIIGILFLSESSEMTLSFISALILVTLAILLIRKLFSTRKQNIKKTMDSMKISSNIKKLFNLKYKNELDRKVVSGSVARIISFGTVFYLYTTSIAFAYFSLLFAALTGVVLVLAKRHKFSDLSWGVVIGLIAGVVSYKYVPFIMGGF